MDMNFRLATDPASGAVKSAGRVLDLFELLARYDREVPHAEIAEGLGIPRSSLTQLLKDLVARGYVAFHAPSRGYRLGPAFAALARHVGASEDLIGLAEPFLRELTERTGESSALNRLKGWQAEVVATVNGPHRLVTHMRLGDLAPLYATSGGKVILASLTDAEIDTYLASTVLEPVTPDTIVSKDALRKELDAARRDGVAFSFGEFTPGIVGIGAPILSATGQPLGSLNVAMPSIRYSPEARARVTEAIRRATREISRRASRAPAD
ncbi:IclR family transcriptional regulator [Roseomonas populi]|uniref:IclR family transcriptional regulator n=1 Tax=Roseomonas populi TaxID=3121582 RepID=A0ABT1XBU8_9PROT|nr:IclR family transcriptional regulator [Roseomonas pecuniae]MCR0985605.1 IclR family transcriptional regulator [Roseomonas pecuniae]